MSDSTARLLILQTGDTAPQIARAHGNYDGWFTRRMEPLGCRFTVHRADTQGLPELSGFDGILVTGATASVLDSAPWMEPLADFFRNLDTSPGPPVLAVCFAAQLAAVALGGRVEKNSEGWEIGTIQVEATAAGRNDLLFAGLPSPFPVQATHEDRIIELPAGARCLAQTPITPVQAFRHGNRLAAVQFHPEANAPLLRDLVELRREVLAEDMAQQRHCSLDTARQQVSDLKAGIQASPWGPAILKNWLVHTVHAAH